MTIAGHVAMRLHRWTRSGRLALLTYSAISAPQRWWWKLNLWWWKLKNVHRLFRDDGWL